MKSLEILVAGYHHRANILGAHVYIHGLVRTLRDRGHRVTFLQVAHPDHRVSIDGVRMVYLGDRGKRYYAMRYALRRLGGYDVIHTHYVAGAFLGLRSRLHAIPMVAQFHVPEVPAESLWTADWRWKYLALAVKFAPTRLTPTRWLAGALGERHGVDPEAFKVIPYGIGEHWFRAADAPAPTPPSKSPRVVLVNMKGVDVALQAFGKIAASTDATLELFGAAGRHADFEATTRELGITDRVLFRGFVPNPELPAALRGADVLLHPNFSGNMDQVLLESQTLGIPAVTSRVNGNPECIEDGKTAFLCPAGDSSAFATRLLELLSSPDLRTRFGEAARVRARELFHWDNVATRLEDEIYLPLSRGERVDPRGPGGR